MREEYFVNIAFDTGIKSYLSIENKEGIKYNSFLVVVIRLLVLIYGEADILNPFYLNNKVVFLNNLAKYGMAKSDIAVFKEEFLNYYKFEVQNIKKTIKQKNPYFKNTLKYLIDMFIFKKRNATVSFEEEEAFLDLAYTTHTKNPYRISYNYLNNSDINFFEKYYYSKLNELDVTKDLENTINMNLNLEALKYVGINLSNIHSLSEAELASSKDKAYNYFEVDATKPSRDEELKENIDYLKTYGKKKVTSGNGYVDILLLLSVIITSFSILSIIVFCF